MFSFCPSGKDGTVSPCALHNIRQSPASFNFCLAIPSPSCLQNCFLCLDSPGGVSGKVWLLNIYVTWAKLPWIAFKNRFLQDFAWMSTSCKVTQYDYSLINRSARDYSPKPKARNTPFFHLLYLLQAFLCELHSPARNSVAEAVFSSLLCVSFQGLFVVSWVLSLTFCVVDSFYPALFLTISSKACIDAACSSSDYLVTIQLFFAFI